MRSFLAAAFISIFFLSSCDNSSHPDIDTSLPAVTNTPVSPEKSAMSDSMLSEMGLDLENIDPKDLKQAPAEVYRAAGLNPPHGEPGHDCAIAVGAPLNGSPAANTIPSAPPTMNFPTSPIAAPSPAAAPGGPRLNPPHGQPGHDCAVQVGAPLS